VSVLDHEFLSPGDPIDVPCKDVSGTTGCQTKGQGDAFKYMMDVARNHNVFKARMNEMLATCYAYVTCDESVFAKVCYYAR
jgi:hypothetical protein